MKLYEDRIWDICVRFIENGTIYLADFVFNELRSVDTLIIDGGHSMRLAIIGVGYRDTENEDSWSVATADALWTTDAPVYKTFTAKQALSWRIKIGVFTTYADVPVAKIPLLYLGERWTMPHYFSGYFDPHKEDRIEDIVTSERGIMQYTKKYNQRIFGATMSHLSSTDYENIKYFFADTSNGAKPFFFLWQPSTDPSDMLYLKLNSARDVPYSGGTLRSWAFEAKEVIGKRLVL